MADRIESIEIESFEAYQADTGTRCYQSHIQVMAILELTRQVQRIADVMEKANAPTVHQVGSNRPAWQMSQEEIDKRRELERFWAEKGEQDRAAADEVEMHECMQRDRKSVTGNFAITSRCDGCPDSENCRDYVPF